MEVAFGLMVSHFSCPLSDGCEVIFALLVSLAAQLSVR